MNKLFDVIKNWTPRMYLSVSIKDEIKAYSKELKDKKFEKLKTTLNELIDKKEMSKKTYDLINTLITELNKDNITDEEACDLIEETITILKDDDDIDLENILDNECTRYNKFTQSNPAEYISYEETQKRYILKYNNNVVKRKNISELIKILKEKSRDK